MSEAMGRPLVRRALGALLLAPLTSLLLSRLLSAAVGAAGLASSLPVGVHTYVPGVDLVDIRSLAVAGLLLAVPGLALLSWDGGPRTRWRAIGQVGLLLAAAQLLLYAGQALLVAQVQGLPDAAPAVLLAVALPAALTLAATAALSVASVLTAVLSPAVALPVPPAAAAVLHRWPFVAARRCAGILVAPLRGPPPSRSATSG